MDPTALYYTFTTIAQALAGAFGVLAAFAVLSLARIEAEIGAAQDVVLDVRDPYEPAWETFEKQGLDEFLKSQASKDSLGIDRFNRLKRGEIALGMQRFMRRRLIIASAMTGIDIGISIVAIPWVPVLACSAVWSIVVTAVTVGLGLICLVLYGTVVVAVIHGRSKQSAQRRRQPSGAGP
jgi:hypothetical protein